jgi:hypothetical protein
LLGAASQCKHDRLFLFIVKGEKQIKSEKKWWDPQGRSRGKYGLPAVVEIKKFKDYTNGKIKQKKP